MKRVKSSNIYAIGYDDKKKILTIRFINTGVYEYKNVEQKVYDELMAAESHGKYFNANIKGNPKYEWKKVN